MFVLLTNDTTYLMGNEGQNICAVFSENAAFKSYGVKKLIANEYILPHLDIAHSYAITKVRQRFV